MIQALVILTAISIAMTTAMLLATVQIKEDLHEGTRIMNVALKGIYMAKKAYEGMPAYEAGKEAGTALGVVEERKRCLECLYEAIILPQIAEDDAVLVDYQKAKELILGGEKCR